MEVIRRPSELDLLLTVESWVHLVWFNGNGLLYTNFSNNPPFLHKQSKLLRPEGLNSDTDNYHEHHKVASFLVWRESEVLVWPTTGCVWFPAYLLGWLENKQASSSLSLASQVGLVWLHVPSKSS